MRGNLSREAQPAVVTTVGTDPVPRSATPTPMPCDVEVAPKKTGVSLRRAKQFALVEAPSAKRIQLGLDLGASPPPNVGGHEKVPIGGHETAR